MRSNKDEEQKKLLARNALGVGYKNESQLAKEHSVLESYLAISWISSTLIW